MTTTTTTYLPEQLELADDSAESLYELLESRGLGDGLPVVPPTLARVEAMLAFADGRPRRGALHAAAALGRR